MDQTEPIRFVALSYVWRTPKDAEGSRLLQCNVNRMQQRGSLDLSVLPDVISDAVTLHSELGEPFLWVNRLCIVQDDLISKHSQIRAMDQIYGAATFTIVAAVSDPSISRLPGVRGRPRNSFLSNRTHEFNAEGGTVSPNFHMTVDRSPWNSRGWTFQERLLSRRCLYVTDFQVYFVCGNAVFQEDLGPVPHDDQIPYLPNLRKTRSTINGVMFDYFAYVENYTARKLSYEVDILNAFSGVKNMSHRY
jgi:hypothetical protein